MDTETSLVLLTCSPNFPQKEVKESVATSLRPRLFFDGHCIDEMRVVTAVYIRLQTVWILGIVGRTITLPSGFRLVFEPRVGVSGKDSVGLYFKMPDLVDLEDWQKPWTVKTRRPC